MKASITDVPGIRVGHWTDERARTGCTVVLGRRPDIEALCVAAVEVTAEAIRRAVR